MAKESFIKIRYKVRGSHERFVSFTLARIVTLMLGSAAAAGGIALFFARDLNPSSPMMMSARTFLNEPPRSNVENPAPVEPPPIAPSQQEKVEPLEEERAPERAALPTEKTTEKESLAHETSDPSSLPPPVAEAPEPLTTAVELINPRFERLGNSLFLTVGIKNSSTHNEAVSGKLHMQIGEGEKMTVTFRIKRFVEKEGSLIFSTPEGDAVQVRLSIVTSDGFTTSMERKIVPELLALREQEAQEVETELDPSPEAVTPPAAGEPL